MLSGGRGYKWWVAAVARVVAEEIRVLVAYCGVELIGGSDAGCTRVV